MEINSVNLYFLHKHNAQSSLNHGLEHIKSLPYISVVQATEGTYSISINGSSPLLTGEGGFFVAPSQATQKILHLQILVLRLLLLAENLKPQQRLIF